MKGNKNHLRIIITFLFIAFSLLIVIQCQRGRGGSSSFSSGSRSGFSSSPSYSRNYYSGGGYGYGTGSSGSTIASIIGGICFLCCGCGICMYCCKQSGTGQGFMQRFTNNNDPNFMNQKNPQVLEQQFQRLKMTKNFISPNTISFEQFQNIKNQFVTIFNNPNSIFTYTQSGQTTRISNKRVSVVPQTQFAHRLQFQGNDEVGAWIGRGYILATINGPYVWWMKDYRDKSAAGQTGQSQFLIYESTSYNPGFWTGRWYFEGDQYHPDYSGNWTLKGSISPANPFNMIANNMGQYNM